MMKKVRSLQPLALAAILLATACGGPVTNDQAGEVNAADEAANDPVLQDEAVEVAALPEIPSGLGADDAAPLSQASAIAREIVADATVERVPFEDGWAWRRNGQTVRTASRDGRRVSYFRPGESAPFFVQQGEESFAYASGRVQRAYDRRGRPAAVTPARREAAQRLADGSRREREKAQRAPRPDAGSQAPAENRVDRRARPSDRDDRASGRTPPAAGNDQESDPRSTRDRRRRDAAGDDERGNRLQPRD